MERMITLNATGETITFIKTKAETNGKFLEIIVTLPDKESRPRTHRHPLQQKSFQAIEGRLALDYRNEVIILEPGQTFDIPANTNHNFYPADADAVKFRVTYTPALNYEYMLREMFEACNRNNSKHANPFDIGFILRQGKGEYFIAAYPDFLQTLGFIVTAFIGRISGLSKTLSKAERGIEP